MPTLPWGPQASTGEGVGALLRMLLFPGSKLETAQRCLLVALPFLHGEQVLDKVTQSTYTL